MRCRSLRVATVFMVVMPMVSIPAGAQGRPQDAPHADGHSHGLHFAHPIFTESVSPDTKVRLDYVRTWEGEANEDEIELEGEYAFHRSFSVEVAAPYAFVTPDAGATRSGLANVEVALKFANFAFEHHGLLLGYGLGVGLPTGDSASGIGSHRIWELEPFLNVGWQRDGFELVAWGRFGVPANLEAGAEVETEFHYDLSALYHVSRRIQALVELNGESRLSPPGDGVLSIAPGLKIAPLARQPLYIGVAGSWPLGDEELDARGRLSLFYHF